jgi:hypothetical protein
LFSDPTSIKARRNYGSLTTPIVFTSVSNPPPANPYLTGVNALPSELKKGDVLGHENMGDLTPRDWI